MEREHDRNTENAAATERLHIKFGISESLYEKAVFLTKTDQKAVSKYAARLLKGNASGFRKKDGLFRLAAVMEAARSAREKYLKLGIPEKIFSDTFRDVGYRCDNAFEQYSREGLMNVKWPAKHLSLRVFRPGRLQF